MQRNNSITSRHFTDFQASEELVRNAMIRNDSKPPQPPQKNSEDQLIEQNNILKRKLFALSARLEEQKQALEEKTKVGAVPSYIQQALSSQKSSVQLQNAHRTIQRLQKSVHNYENNESFQMTFKKIQELQSIIKDKTSQAEALKVELKFLNKGIKEKSKHIEDLEEQKVVIPNDQQQKQEISKLKQRLKKLTMANKELIRKQMQKHSKLITVEQRILVKQQEEDEPVSKEEELKGQIQQFRQKLKDSQARVEKQKNYILKLKKKLTGQNTDAKEELKKIINSNPPVSQLRMPGKNESKYVEEMIESEQVHSNQPKRKQGESRMSREWRSVAEMKEPKKDLKQYLLNNVPAQKLPNRLFRRF